MRINFFSVISNKEIIKKVIVGTAGEEFGVVKERGLCKSVTKPSRLASISVRLKGFHANCLVSFPLSRPSLNSFREQEIRGSYYGDLAEF